MTLARPSDGSCDQYINIILKYKILNNLNNTFKFDEIEK